MTTFDTARPVELGLELFAATVRVSAADLDQTVVEVAPEDPNNPADLSAAEQTRVDRAGDRISVVGRQSRRILTPWGSAGSVLVHVQLPARSQLTGRLATGSLDCVGPLGECRITLGAGKIAVEAVEAVRLRTGAGDVVVGRVRGRADVSTGSGTVRLGQLGGQAVVKNSNGATSVQQASGELRVQAANGPVVVERVDGGLVAKTANGDVRVGRLSGGSVTAESGCGDVEVGIDEGRAAWLELHSHFGRVVNHLEETGPPAPDQPTVELRARTGMGDITVRRAAASAGSEAENLSVPPDRLPL